MADEDVTANGSTDSSTSSGGNTGGAANQDVLNDAVLQIERLLASSNLSSADIENIKSIIATNPGVESKVNIPANMSLPEELQSALRPANTPDGPDQPQRMQAAEEARPIDAPETNIDALKDKVFSEIYDRVTSLGGTPQVAMLTAAQAKYDIGQSTDAANYALNNTDDAVRTALHEVTNRVQDKGEKLAVAVTLSKIEMNGVVADSRNYTSGMFPSEVGAPAQNAATAPAVDNGLAIT